MQGKDSNNSPTRSKSKQILEKRYAIVPKESISLYADSIGHPDLPDTICSMLAEDVTYRIREATQKACQFMKHAKRQRLTVTDFNRALKHAHVEPLYGHEAGDSVSFRQLKDEDLFFHDDPDISNLGMLATSSKFHLSTTGQPTVKGCWLENAPSQAPTQFISKDLLTYYDKITAAILGNDLDLMKVALLDLRTNDKIGQLISYFVNFVSSGIRTSSHDITKLTKLLHTIKALINNNGLFLEPKPFLQLLLDSLFFCMLEPYTASFDPLNDHWVVRDTAADLMAQITRKWSNPVNGLYHQNLSKLLGVLVDTTKPWCAMYGALVGLREIGPQAFGSVLQYLSDLNTHIEVCLNDCTYQNGKPRADAQKVQGTLLLACQHYMIKVMNEHVELKTDQQTHCTDHGTLQGIQESLLTIYGFMHDLFGDQLIPRLPLPTMHQAFVNNEFEEKIVSLSDPDSAKTGEELLAQFLIPDKKEEEVLSVSTEHVQEDMDVDIEGKSSSEHSFNSDYNLGSSGGLAIKKTVDDPTLGRIKLVLARVKLEKPSKSEKKKKKQRQAKMYEVFEDYCCKKLGRSVMFKFFGRKEIWYTRRFSLLLANQKGDDKRKRFPNLPLFSKKRKNKIDQSKIKRKICYNIGLMFL